MPYCGMQVDGQNARDAVMLNLQAVWQVTTIKLNERKFLLQSARGNEQGRDLEGLPMFECLVFEKQGAATNPSLYNWGNGDTFCGVGDWEGKGKDIALLSNKQAVFILQSV